MNETISREALFALVWARPSTEVARELGISDVALGKLCRKLQVPKPPRGYWARVASSETPKRPPLPAYREELAAKLRGARSASGRKLLTPLQQQFLARALAALGEAGGGTQAGRTTGRDAIRDLSPELVAEVLILLQNRYEEWLDDRKSARDRNAGLRSLANLVGKLQPLAKTQLLIFRRRREDGGGPAITMRATTDFLARLAQLSRLARDNGLAYVASELPASDYAWSLKPLYPPEAWVNCKTTVCVSVREVWLRGEGTTRGSCDRFETRPLLLKDICPTDLTSENTRRLPGTIRRAWTKPYAARVKALVEAERLYDGLVKEFYETERIVPSEKLALFDRLWFSPDGPGPFSEARRAWRRVDADVERWERELEGERAALCADVLGVQTGDIVLIEHRGKPLRITVEGLSTSISDEQIIFVLWGRRFRQDGLPGKRSEQFYIDVENDLVE